MPMMSVKVRFVNEPRNNPNFGSIKTTDNDFISVPVEKLGQFQPGRSYDIIVDVTPKGFKNFKGFAQQQGGYQQAPQGRQQQRPQMQRRPVQPSLPANPPMNPEARTIFITGVVGRAMGGGSFHATDIHTLTAAAAAAWDHVILGIEPPPVKQYTAEEAFDDDLPPQEMYDGSDRTPVDRDVIPY